MSALRAALIAVAVLLAPTTALARPGLLDAVIQPDGVLVTDDDKPVLFYRTKPEHPGEEPGRLNYVHPLYAPDGTILTEDRPADHLHQRGLFWSWHQVRIGDRQVADGWFMDGLTFFVKRRAFATDATGAGTITIDADWLVTSGADVSYVAIETTTVRIQPVKDGKRRIDFETTITPSVDGLSLGGSDDVKGYGGFSMRLIAPEALVFASDDGKALKAQVGPVEAGRSMGFAWPGQPGLGSWAVGLACRVDGKPIRQWILRREKSMQNCAWPGRAPVALTKGKPLRLSSTVVVRPAK